MICNSDKGHQNINYTALSGIYSELSIYSSNSSPKNTSIIIKTGSNNFESNENTKVIESKTSNKNIEESKKHNSSKVTPFSDDSEKTIRNKNYSENFLSKFENFPISKTFCEKLCMRSGSNIARLRKLKKLFPDENEQEIINFICEKYEELSKSQIEKYSVVDIYIVCSLIENNEVYNVIKANKSLFDRVKEVTDEFIKEMSLHKKDDQEFFFHKTKDFFIKEIMEHGNDLNKIRIHEISEIVKESS